MVIKEARPALTSSRAFIYPHPVSTSDSLIRKQISFGIAGLIFGGLLGFVAAHEIYVGRAGKLTPVPANSPTSAAPMGAGLGGAGGMPPGGAPGMETMKAVRRELDALKGALEGDPENLTALTRLGNLYMDAGMFERAVEYYGRSLGVDDTNNEVRTDMGTCLRRLGRPEEALKHFKDSVRRDPQHWRSWFNMGVVYMYDLGEYDEAEAAFAKVLEVNPESGFDMNAVREEIEELKAKQVGS